ncbi:MAG: hypothetical protein IJ120_01410 [Solobacterium sp.]|nr:hypothetical protein [Solobacterium sp.]
MTVNVIYYSRRGKTRKVAEAIASVCGVTAMNIEEPHNISDTDLLFVGMGIYGGSPDPALLSYLDTLPVNTIKGAAVFCLSDSGRDRSELAVNLLTHKGISVYPRHLALRGRFLFLGARRPNEKDLRRAKRFAGEVLEAYQGDASL